MKNPVPGESTLQVTENVAYPLAAIMLLAATYAALNGVRNILPEPFDVPSHVGNVAGSYVVGYITGIIVGGEYDGAHETPGRVQQKAIAAGACAGVLMNTLFETKLGVSITQGILAPNTPDMIDLAYGIAGAAVGGYSSNRIEVVSE
jgi:galactitol-specific phosphotransferase system IIC component